MKLNQTMKPRTTQVSNRKVFKKVLNPDDSPICAFKGSVHNTTNTDSANMINGMCMEESTSLIKAKSGLFTGETSLRGSQIDQQQSKTMDSRKSPDTKSNARGERKKTPIKTKQVLLQVHNPKIRNIYTSYYGSPSHKASL